MTSYGGRGTVSLGVSPPAGRGSSPGAVGACPYRRGVTSDADTLRGLADGADVVLDVGEEAIACRVNAVAGDEATLAPRTAADEAYIPSLGRPAVLVFDAGRGRRRRVAGAVRRGPATGGLRFAAGQGAGLPPRRRAARLGIDLAVELTLLDAGGAPAAPPRRLRASDVSLGGLGVRAEGWALPAGALLRHRLELPDPPPIEGTSRVLRVEGGVAGLELAEISPADRSRLAAFLIARR